MKKAVLPLRTFLLSLISPLDSSCTLIPQQEWKGKQQAFPSPPSFPACIPTPNRKAHTHAHTGTYSMPTSPPPSARYPRGGGGLSGWRRRKCVQRVSRFCLLGLVAGDLGHHQSISALHLNLPAPREHRQAVQPVLCLGSSGPRQCFGTVYSTFFTDFSFYSSQPVEKGIEGCRKEMDCFP